MAARSCCSRRPAARRTTCCAACRNPAAACWAFMRCRSGGGRSRPPRSTWLPAACARSPRSEPRPSPPAPPGWRRRTASWSACPRLPACRGSPARWPRRSANCVRPAFRRRHWVRRRPRRLPSTTRGRTPGAPAFPPASVKAAARSWTTTARGIWAACSSASPPRWSGSDWPTAPPSSGSPRRPWRRGGRSCRRARSGSTFPCATAPRPTCWRLSPRAAGRSWRPSPLATSSRWSG